MAEEKASFNSDGFYRALDSARQARGLNWKDVSGQTNVSTSTLTRMAQDRRPDASSLAILSAWAGVNPADFVSFAGRTRDIDALTTISKCLTTDPNLSEESASALDEMVKAAYQRMVKRKPSI